MRTLTVCLCCALLFSFPIESRGQTNETMSLDDFIKALRYLEISWQVGPATVKVGDQAEIFVPAGYKITDASGTRLWFQLSENLYKDECAVVCPSNHTWSLIFGFDPCGRVSDDEGASLNATAILRVLKDNTIRSNVERKRLGYRSLFVDDWIVPPRYNQVTRRLEWAYSGHNDQNNAVANFDTRILGRYGVMHVKLVAKPEEIVSLIPTVNEILNGFRYNTGHGYTEWRAGDKVASYGLTALITGAAVGAAAKAGWLNRLGPVLVKGIGVVVAALLAWFGALFARRAQGVSQSTSMSAAGSCILPCNRCGQKLRVPSQQGLLVVTCPRCGNKFEHRT